MRRLIHTLGNKNWFGQALTVLVLGGLGAFVTGAAAQTSFSIESIGSKVGLGDSDLLQVVYNIIRWALGFLTFAALVFVMYGGFLWLTANGDEKRIEKAKRVILQALIGMVIVLLAWAIVLFVARFFQRATTNGNTNNTNVNAPCLPGTPDCTVFDPANSFNVTTVATCAANRDYQNNVPRSSRVAVFFNAPVDQAPVEQAVMSAADTTEDPKLKAMRCDLDATNTTCNNPNTGAKPVDRQRYSANQSIATEADPVSEWIAKTRSNAIVYSHTSFNTTDDANPANQLFEAQKTYRIQIPRKGAANALTDQTFFNRPLERCQGAGGTPVPGCVVDEAANNINWTFTTSNDIEGPAITVERTVPRSTYKYPTPLPNPVPTPNRDVDRDSALCIYFSTAVDPTSVELSSFTVTKYRDGSVPTLAGGWLNGDLEATPLPTTNFKEDPYFIDGGTGVCIKPKDTDATYYDAFTWYRVKVENVRSLCGTEMAPNPFEWVFQTNDRLPGPPRLYPPDGFDKSCPATKVKAVFPTSMWNGEADDCEVNIGSTVTGGDLTTGGVSAGRTFEVSDPLDPLEPNRNCRVYEFTPTTTLLRPGATYNGTILTNRQIDSSGKLLEVGTPTSDKPWSFKVVDADKCIQPPLITRVSPSIGKHGQCVSVIGDYFETGTEKKTGSNGKPETGDALTLGARNQLTDPDVVWTDNSIVTVVDAGPIGDAGSLTRDGSKYTYKVTVRYPSPIGDLSDELTEAFKLEEGDGSNGPCLLSLSKTSGPPETSFSANGKRFGDTAGTVNYSLAPGGIIPSSSWTDRQINVKTPSTTSLGRVGVSVTAGSQQSNEIDFETTPIPPIDPGAPRIIEATSCNLDVDPQVIPNPSPRDGDATVCLNTHPEVRFDRDMNAASLLANGAIVMEDCTTGICAPVTDISKTLSVNNRRVVIAPTTPASAPRLLPGRTYKVTVSADVMSDFTPPATGVRMGRAYSWSFKTKSDDSDCPIAGISINEPSTLFRDEPFTYALSSSTRDASCREVTGSCSTYTWRSSKDTVATVAATTPGSGLATSAGSIVEGATDITVQCQTKTSNKVKITYDPLSCTTNTDCQGVNRFNESCGASSCVSGKCSPLVTKLVQDNGAVGNYTSIHGCWFGTYNVDSSKVIFGADQGPAAREAPAFSPDVCDSRSSWQNDYIIRAVPNEAVDGTVKVIRRDSQEASSLTNFDVNSIVRPGICKLVPAKGDPGAAVTVVGVLLGTGGDRPSDENDLTAQDGVFIQSTTDLTGTTKRAMSTYDSWTASSIGTRVPTTSAFGKNSVRAKANNQESNDVLFTVTDPSVTSCIACTDATVCPNTAAGTPQGCSATTRCCAPRPVVVETNPDTGTGICRNVAPQITYSLPLDASTVNTTNVIYRDNGTTPSGVAVRSSNSGGQGTIHIYPGLLSPDADQSVTIVPNTVRGQNGVAVDLAQTPLTFRTGTEICSLDSFRLTPTAQWWTKPTDSGAILGEAYSRNGTPIAQTPGYSWSVTWLSANTSIATIEPVNVTNSFAIANATSGGTAGRTTIKATASIEVNSLDPNNKPRRTGMSSIYADFCANPWPSRDATSGNFEPFKDSTSNCDVDGSGCLDFHFSMHYCRGSGSSNLLPALDYAGSDSSALGAIEGVNGTLGRLKSMFFKTGADETDVIGILIYPNDNFLSPREWFAERFPSRAGTGSATTVGGYPALQVGTTTYVGVTLLDGGTLGGRMFVFDYNSNQASTTTKTIFARLLDNIVFNYDLSPLERNQIQRDTQRLQDLTTISRALERTKGSTGNYPALSAGTYIAGLSTSRWPSWQSTLGSALGTALPVDPDNTFARTCNNDATLMCTNDEQCGGGTGDICKSTTVCAAPYENATCWAESTKTFKCPADSAVYIYQKTADGYQLYANMEYSGPGAFQNYTPGAPDDVCTGADCPCTSFQYNTGTSLSPWRPVTPMPVLPTR